MKKTPITPYRRIMIYKEGNNYCVDRGYHLLPSISIYALMVQIDELTNKKQCYVY